MATPKPPNLTGAEFSLLKKKNNISDPAIIIKILLVPAAISKLKFNKMEIRISLKKHTTYNF